MKHLMIWLAVAALAGCGVAETGTTAATVGAAKAKESEEAQNTVQRFEQKLDAAQQQTMDRTKAADQADQ